MKKFCTLFVAVLTLILLTGCTRKPQEIKASQIFDQEGMYYVYFYKDGCTDCERTKPFVLNYFKNVEEGKGNRKIYMVNLSKSENKLIYRGYTGSDGQGDGTFYVDDVDLWTDLYIGATSALIRVGISDDKKIASFIASGATNIELSLNDELKK